MYIHTKYYVRIMYRAIAHAEKVTSQNTNCYGTKWHHRGTSPKLNGRNLLGRCLNWRQESKEQLLALSVPWWRTLLVRFTITTLPLYVNFNDKDSLILAFYGSIQLYPAQVLYSITGLWLIVNFPRRYRLFLFPLHLCM